ncbi:MAG: hypothetical protein KF851_10010 [Pirellulaceae bacterium]|nr:hypothetical protein [Pirellulaceae bacterium]
MLAKKWLWLPTAVALVAIGCGTTTTSTETGNSGTTQLASSAESGEVEGIHVVLKVPNMT